jgi:hypothetical protein
VEVNKKKEKKKKQKNLFADPDFFGQYKSSQGPYAIEKDARSSITE